MVNPSSTLLLEPDALLARTLLRQLPETVSHAESWPAQALDTVLLRASTLKAEPKRADQAGKLVVLMDVSTALPDHATAIALPVRRDRLRAALGGAPDATAQPIGGIGSWQPLQRKLTSKEGASVTLTEKEAALFTALHESGNGLDSDALRQHVWPGQAQTSPHALPALLSRLRAQLDTCFGDAFIIAYEDGIYRLQHA